MMRTAVNNCSPLVRLSCFPFFVQVHFKHNIPYQQGRLNSYDLDFEIGIAGVILKGVTEFKKWYTIKEWMKV
jgi:hypothetical protein